MTMVMYYSFFNISDRLILNDLLIVQINSTG